MSTLQDVSSSLGRSPLPSGSWWRRAVVLAAALAMVFASQSEFVSADQPDRAGSNVGKGANAGVAMGGPWTWSSPEAQARDLNQIATLGVGWVRVSFPWSAMEPRPGRFDWSTHDAIVRMAHARGLDVIANVSYTPRWARSPLCFSTRCAPIFPDRYAGFLARVVDRYSTHGVTVVEVWNEPNLAAFWRPAPDPAAYTRLLLRAYDAAKRADPTVTVVSGGLAPAGADSGSSITPLSFLRAVYASGGRRAFDGVGIHPYSYPRSPMDPHPQNTFAQLPSLRNTMVANGDGGKQLWLTEFGYWTAPPGPLRPRRSVTPEQQAAYLVEAFEAVERWPWTGPLIWYAHRDLAPKLLSGEDNFGLRYHDDTPKPAWVALDDLMREGTPP